MAALIVATLLATAGSALPRVATFSDRVASGQSQKNKNLIAGQKEVKRLLLLMDQDPNGKVSKAEFMKFMEAEFDRLDKDNSGELDVHRLTESPVHSSGPIHR